MSRRTSTSPSRTLRTRLLPTLAAGLGLTVLAACSGGGSLEPTEPDVEAPGVVEQEAEDATDTPAVDDLEDADLDALLGSTGADTGSRLLGVETCGQVGEVVAPLLLPHLEPSVEEVQNDGYPLPGPYVYRCSWHDPEHDYVHLSVHGSADWGGETREELVAQHQAGMRDIAPGVVDHERHWNLLLLAEEANAPHRGRFIMHVASPAAPNAAMTGWVSVSYGLGLEGHPPKGEMPSDEVAATVLLGLAEDATDD